MIPNLQRRQPGDENLIVSFREDDPLNMREEPTGVKVDFITIKIPGDRFNVIDVPVTPEYAKRFAADYEDWKANRDAGTNGTPLESMGGISPSHIRALHNENVFTVEQLARLSDGALQRLQGGIALRDAARRKLGMTSADPEAMAALQKTVAAQAEQIAELMAALKGKTLSLPKKEA